MNAQVDWTAMLTWLRERVDTDDRMAQEASPKPIAEDLEFGDNPHVWTDPYGEFRSRGGPVFAHVLRHNPGRVLAEVAAKRAMLDDWQRQRDTVAEWYAKPDAELHAHFMHPDWEYTTTEGQRKAWDYADEPPEGDGWVRNVDAGRDGWERFDYTEESYWRRLLPEDKRGGKEPEPPRHIRQMVTAYRHEQGYRTEWAPEVVNHG